MKTINKLITGIALLAIAVSAAGEIVSVTGTTPTHREDGELLGLSEIQGFNIHYGVTPGDYQQTINIPGATLPDTSWDLDLPVGTYYAVVTTLDIDDRESQYSNEVTIVIEGKSKPNPPLITPETVIRKAVTLPVQ